MKNKGWIFIIVVIAFQVGFLLFQVSTKNFFVPDSKDYLNASINLTESGVLYSGNMEGEIETSLYTRRTHGYPVFLFLCGKISSNPILILILQSVISLFSIFLMIKMFKLERKTLFPLVLIILYPLQFIYSCMILPEILFQFIIMLAFFCLWNFIQGKHRRNLWIFQTLLIIGILIKPILVFFLIPNFIFFFIRYVRKQRRLTLISSLIPLIFIIIIGGINQQKTGHFHLTSIQKENIINKNLYLHALENNNIEEAIFLRDSIIQKCKSTESLEDRSECLSQSFRNYISHDILSYSLFQAKNLVRSFLDPTLKDVDYFFRGKESGNTYFLGSGFKGILTSLKQLSWSMILLLSFIFIINLARLIGFIAYLFNKNIRKEFRLALLFMVGIFAFTYVPDGSGQYFLPIALLVTGSAAWQFAHWFLKKPAP